MQDILGAIDALGLNEEPRQGYPSRCQRRAEAILGYDDAARNYNEHGGHMPIYDACGCMAVAAGEAFTSASNSFRGCRSAVRM